MQTEGASRAISGREIKVGSTLVGFSNFVQGEKGRGWAWKNRFSLDVGKKGGKYENLPMDVTNQKTDNPGERQRENIERHSWRTA